MASERNRQRQALLTTLIALIALLGLMAGVITRTLITSAASLGQSPRTESTATTAVKLTPELSPTATQAPTVAPSLAHFTLRLTVSPSSGHVGDTITISVRATDEATGAPIPGLTCHLRAPTDGANGLFTTWPTPTATNSSGIALWTTTIPSNAPGRYEIEVFAQTPSWSEVRDAGVTVTTS